MMKKLFSSILLLFSTILLFGQTPEMQMKITIKPGDSVSGKIVKGDGTEETVNLEGILILDPDAFSSIEFEYKPLPEALDHVQLTEGSKIEWATINFGATAPKDPGKLVAWPMEDIVYSTWTAPYLNKGYKWRMPTKEELQELKKCGWKKGDLNGKVGFWVYNRDDEEKLMEERRKIFLPVTGYVGNNEELIGTDSKGNYWSSTTNENALNRAYCLITEPDSIDYKNGYYYGDQSKAYKLAIRPVWGDPMISAEIIASHRSVTYKSATISMTLKSDNDISVNSYGVRLSESLTDDGKLKNPMDFVGTGLLVRKVPTDIELNNSNLHPIKSETTYYYQAYAHLSSGFIVESELNEHTKFRTREKSLKIELGDITASANSAIVKIKITGDELQELTYGIRYAETRDSLRLTNVKKKLGIASLNDSLVSVELTNLTPDKTYYIQAFAEGNGRNEIIESNFKTLRNSKFKEPTRIVDLGLSVKWANFNLGATSETEKGGRYGWGDISGDSTNIWPSNYAPGLYEMSIAGDEQYDIVAANLGGNWRMPTVDELNELNQCRWVYSTNYNNMGVNGYLVYGIGAYSKQFIFIPFAGYRRGTEIVSDNNVAYWWTSQVNGAGDAIYMNMIGRTEELSTSKSFGLSVRPVYDDGEHSGSSPNLDPTKAKTEKAPDGSLIPQTGVDMGFPSGTKWANWNLGAMTTTGATGKFYSFGELAEKNSYTNELYDFNKNGENISGDDPDYFVNGNLLPEFDAAFNLWGEDWRMPSEDQIDELIMNSTAEWKDNYHGQSGYLFVSNYNGNSIFLPAAGIINGESNPDRGTFGCYWSCSKCTSTTDKRLTHAMQMLFSHEYGSSTTSEYRYKGCTIRPVMPKK